jgi:hypothetical protein
MFVCPFYPQDQRMTSHSLKTAFSLGGDSFFLLVQIRLVNTACSQLIHHLLIIRQGYFYLEHDESVFFFVD